MSDAAGRAERPAPGAAFYCVSSAEYFLGAVAMINSLRLHGHNEPVHVMDCGLTDGQRRLLDPHAQLAQAPAGREPHTLKAVLPLQRPAQTAVLVDTDMIVTRSLAPVIERAAAGGIAAFRNNSDRHVEAWSSVLGLGPIRRQPYVCAGLVAAGGEVGRRVLETMEDRQGRVDLSRSYFGSHDDDYELLYADQDVLNAVLASSVEADRVSALAYRLAPMVPFRGVRVIDAERLRCAYADGTEPYLLHHSLSPKPWQRPAYGGVYATLLRRLLNGEDVAVRVPRELIPLDLRDGPAAAGVRGAVKAATQVRWRIGGLRDRLRAAGPSQG